MVSIHNIRQSILEESSINGYWGGRFGRRHEETASYVGALLECAMGRGMLETMRAICEGDFDDDVPDAGGREINTYPFGKPSDKVFPEFLGICQGDMRLNKVLSAADKHCRNYVRIGYFDKPACVTIITDKWDPKTFHKYEPMFLQGVLKYGFDFAFYLVTDYGITEIPFVDNHTANILRDQYGKEDVIGVEDGRNIAGILDIGQFSYEYQGALGAEDYGKSERYEFDAELLKWHWEDSDGDEKYGIIPDEALKDFFVQAWPILERYHQDKREICRFMTIENPGAHRILTVGEFEVDFTDKFLKEMPDSKLMDVKRTLDTFIAACLKKETTEKQF